MNLIILLAAVAWTSGAKLDRAYLPPSYAQTSGGNGNFLQTPVSGPQAQKSNDFGPNIGANGVPANNFGQNSNYQQIRNEYAQNGNGFNNEYSQDNGFPQTSNDAYNGFNNLESRPERAQAAFERNAAILRQDSSNDGETYSYSYETENGISAEENGVATNGVEAQGGYSYTGDDGQVYSVRYTADQNGFQPQGDHLPTPPPIPEEILKALEQNARDEANGIYDDGSYDEAKYGSGDDAQFNDNSANSNGYNYNNGNTNAAASFNSNNDDTVVTNNALLSRPGANFGSQGTGFGRQNDVNNAYLPPLERNGQTEAVTRQFNQNGFGPQGPLGGFNNQASNGFRNQVPTTNGVERAYLPPKQFGQRSQNGANRRYQAPGLSSQGPRGIQRDGGSRNGVDKAYLPPFEANPNAPSAIYDQPQTFGQRSPGFNRRNGANREYLPPSANQRTNARNGFGRRPSFNSRDGYRY